MAHKSNNKTKISKTLSVLPMKASSSYYLTLAVFGTMAWLLYKWAFLYCFSIDATNYFSISDIAVPLIIATLLIAIVGILNFLSSQVSQELKKKYNDQYDSIVAAILALFFIVVGICVENKSYIVLGIISLVILIPIALYVKNTWKVLLIACSFTYMVISSAVIKANNIKDIHHTKDFIKIFLKRQSNLKITAPIKLIALNDRYCLLYDIDNKKVIVVRTKNIDYIVKDIMSS